MPPRVGLCHNNCKHFCRLRGHRSGNATDAGGETLASEERVAHGNGAKAHAGCEQGGEQGFHRTLPF